MKARTYGAFLLGMSAGAVVVANWRSLVKKGVRAGLDLKAATMRYADDLSDMVRQVGLEEASVNKPSTSPKSGDGVARAKRVVP